MQRLLKIGRDLGLQILAIYLLLTVPVLVGLVSIDQVVGRNIQRDARAADLALSRAIAQEIDLSISKSLGAVEQLAGYEGVLAADPAIMATVFEVVYRTHPDINLIYRLGPDGIMRYHFPIGPGSTVGTDFSFRAYFQQALTTTHPFVSEGRISPTTEQPVATAVMPLWSADGRFLGVVATNLKLESLSETLTSIVTDHDAGDGLEIVVLDSSARIIAHPDQAWLLNEASSLLPDVYLAAMDGGSGSEITESPAGVERLYSYAPVPGAGWAVLTSRPTAAAFSSQISFHHTIQVVLAAFLGIGLFFWLVLSRRVIAPLEQVATISRGIGRNERVAPEARNRLENLSLRQDQIGRLIRSMLRMEESINARMREQSILLETSTAVVSSLDPDTVLDRILAQVERLMGVRTSAIVALDETQGVFRIRASRGLSENYTEQTRIAPDEPHSLTTRALNSKQPVQVSDTETDPSFISQRPRARAEGYRSVLALPLSTQHAPPAALLVYRPEPHTCTDEEIRLLTSFANQAAMAIENAALYARSDMRLQQQTRRIEALVESLSDGLILGDLSGHVIYANRRIGELADLPPGDLIGASIDKVFARIASRSANPDVVRAAVGRALSDQALSGLEVPLEIDGGTRYLRLQTFDVTDAQDTSIGRGLLINDVTADRELDRMKSNLVATVSHELRTPLAAIKGYATTLLAEDVEWDPLSQREFLSIISGEADRLSELVTNLLDLSRLEAGNLRLSLQDVDLPAVIQRAADRARIQPGNDLEVSIDPSLPPLRADSTRLETVLRNLLENAVKYAGAQARLRVSVNAGNSQAVFRVEDDGPGIPAEETTRIFDRFYQIDSGLNRAAGGAGLGLSICRGLVRAHGGEIWIEPRERGTCIAFSLPFISIAEQSEVRP